MKVILSLQATLELNMVFINITWSRPMQMETRSGRRRKGLWVMRYYIPYVRDKMEDMLVQDSATVGGAILSFREIRIRGVEIGTTVLILPYRSPLETARAFANIDQLSGGRCILGVGVGWAEAEFKALGVPFNKRGAMTNDYLAAIRELWTNNKASYDGKFVQFENVETAPRPLRKPYPPIWVGGSSDAALRRTVRLADAWHPIRFTLDWLRDTGLPRLQATAEEEGKPVPALCPRIRLRIMEKHQPEADRYCGTGTLDQIRNDILGLEALGCDYILLDTHHDNIEASRNLEEQWRMLAVIAEQVLDLDNETTR